MCLAGTVLAAGTIMANETIRNLPLKRLCFKDLFIMTGINSPLQKNNILFLEMLLITE